MAPRSNWKGYLKLSLVSASIAIYPATSYSEKVSFNRLNRQTGNRIKLQNIDSVTGDVVERENIVKGYQVGKDQYVQVEDDELAELAIDSTHTVEIEKFVPKASIDDRYRATPYYLAPEDKVGMEAFAVIRDAMKKKNMVGIGRVVMARLERVMMLEPFGKGIMGTLLHYPYEIRSEESVFEEIPEMKVPDQMVGLAETIIDKMSGEFEPEKFEDRYENAMIELIRSKQAGLPPPKEKPAARPANVVNLMEAAEHRGERGEGEEREARRSRSAGEEAQQESRLMAQAPKVGVRRWISFDGETFAALDRLAQAPHFADFGVLPFERKARIPGDDE
jgi:DNA end-binding protein Ku